MFEKLFLLHLCCVCGMFQSRSLSLLNPQQLCEQLCWVERIWTQSGDSTSKKGFIAREQMETDSTLIRIKSWIWFTVRSHNTKTYMQTTISFQQTYSHYGKWLLSTQLWLVMNIDKYNNVSAKSVLCIVICTLSMDMSWSNSNDNHQSPQSDWRKYRNVLPL